MLLYEFQLNTNENFMQPKLCMLILLRLTKDEVQRDTIVQKKQSYLLIHKSFENP
jgi:hypothetical protein